jgi:hypothetical protein
VGRFGRVIKGERDILVEFVVGIVKIREWD